MTGRIHFKKNKFFIKKAIFAAVLFCCLFLVSLLSYFSLRHNRSFSESSIAAFNKVELSEESLGREIHLSDFNKHESREVEIKYLVRSGETMQSILEENNLSSEEIRVVNNLLYSKIRRFTLYEGQSLYLKYLIRKTWEEETGSFYQSDKIVGPMLFRLNTEYDLLQLKLRSVRKPKTYIISRKSTTKDLTFGEYKTEFIYTPKYIEGTINSNLYEDLLNQKLHPNAIESLINILSYDVDFQRDIRHKDKFKILFNQISEKESGKIIDGQVLYIDLNLKVQRKPLRYYLYKKQYYNKKGQAVDKAFLVTPVPGARLSSRFGYRKHPILGYSRLHAGLDFAAPRNTPIYAASDGVVKFIGWNGDYKHGYGRYIVIRHDKVYSTAYAHLNKFHRYLKKGKRVRKGQVIGYVGTTGSSTGPHLHYEVIKYGKKINPRKVTSLSTHKITKSELPQFRREMEKINNRIKALKQKSQENSQENSHPKQDEIKLEKADMGSQNSHSLKDIFKNTISTKA